jgi:hypothetical protein
MYNTNVKSRDKFLDVTIPNSKVIHANMNEDIDDCHWRLYSASHSRVAPENVGLQKEQKYNTLACHTCNEVRLCVLEIRKRKLAA